MARKFLTPIDLNQNEILNVRVHNLPGTTGPSSPVKGQMYFDSTGNVLYWYNGSGWVAAQGGAGAVPATTVTTQAVGDTGVVGAATTYAREDHKHGRESFGAAVAAPTTFGQPKVDGSATTVARSDHHHGTPTHDAAAHSTFTINNLAAPTADYSWNSKRITTLLDPSAAQDAATKNYVDNAIGGLSWKEAVRVASTVNIAALSGLAAIDGVTPIAGDRILVKNQSSPAANGIYAAASGAWTRATDADGIGELESAAVFVMEGTTQADTAWVLTTDAPITVGTTALTWVQFGGSTITAGAGMTQSGNTLNVIAGAGNSIVVNADEITRGILTGDVTALADNTTTTITNAAVSNTKLANMPSNTIKGNNTGGSASPIDLTVSQVTTMLSSSFLRRFSTTCAAATTTTVTHNLASFDVIVEVRRVASPYDTVEVDVERVSSTQALVRFAVAPAAGEYQIVVVG